MTSAATLAVHARKQALADDALQVVGEPHPRRCLLLGRKNADQSADRLRRVGSVHRGEDHVARFGCFQGDVDGFRVAHLADQNDVGILSERGAQRLRKAARVAADFALADRGLLVSVKELDRILDREDVRSPLGVDVVDHRSQRGALSRAGSSGDQHEATFFCR
jgi:hypothetical protein